MYRFRPVKRLTSAVFCMLFVPTFAGADGHDGVGGISSDGHSYAVTCNENGFMLISTYPVSRFIENGVFSTVREGIETIYLGKSCDAYTEAYGDGTWGLANGGYAISFDDYRIGFPRQEPRCAPDVDTDFTFDFNCPL